MHTAYERGGGGAALGDDEQAKNEGEVERGGGSYGTRVSEERRRKMVGARGGYFVCGAVILYFAILFTEYGTVLQYGNIVWYITCSLLKYTYILSACGEFLFSQKSIARGALHPFYIETPPFPPKKCLSGAAPIGLLCLNTLHTSSSHACKQCLYVLCPICIYSSLGITKWRKNTS
jgi:hypothetical protein